MKSCGCVDGFQRAGEILKEAIAQCDGASHMEQVRALTWSCLAYRTAADYLSLASKGIAAGTYSVANLQQAADIIAAIPCKHERETDERR